MLSEEQKRALGYTVTVALFIVVCILIIWSFMHRKKEDLYSGGFYTSGASDRHNSIFTGTDQVAGCPKW